MSRTHKPQIHVLIAAAGSGTRFGGPLPKQYCLLAGKPVLRRTIEQFLKCPDITSIRVIINPDDAKTYHDTVMGLDLPPPANGGITRKDSVFNGLLSLTDASDEDIILIHDAARPLVSIKNITEIIKAAKEHKAVTAATQITDTLRRTTPTDTMGETVERENLYALQTPQAFKFAVIKGAHESAPSHKTYTDDSAIVSEAGIPVHLVLCSKTNIKITTAEDMKLAEELLPDTTETRTGMGYDVHAFEKGDSVTLCGIKIPHDKKLKGHSDADVGLHAITDAILGAIAEGDIGRHFPPSDPKFKNMDSAIFLEKVRDLVAEKSGKIQNIDLTLICEEPKITPHAPKMTQRVAQILKIDKNRVSIKATTSEGLGFTGRKEGIAAQAIATITLSAGETTCPK